MHSGMEDLIASMIGFGHRAMQRNLIWGNSGNISCRLDEDRMIITGSGASLAELADSDFVIVNIDTGNSADGSLASMETLMHLAFYRTNKNIASVFHSQAFFTTLVSCTDLKVDANLFPESMAYIGRVGRVPYHHPGSKELAGAVRELAVECDCIILSNHGAICGAQSPERVLLKTETLEMLCRLIAFSNIENIQLNYLPRDVRDGFLRHLEEIKKAR